MATSLTNYAEEMLLGLALGRIDGAYPPPPGVWFGLGLWENGAYGPWNETGGGGTEISTSGTGYARVKIDAWTATVSEVVDLGGTGFTRYGRVKTSNAAALLFPPSTAAWSTYELKWGALFDAATGGHCLAYMDFVGSTTPVPAGKQVRFNAGALHLGITDMYYTTAGGARFGVGEFTRQIKEHLLKHLTAQATYLAGPRWFMRCSSFDAIETHNGTYTEVSAAGGYARAATSGLWGAPAQVGGSTARIDLTANVNFPVAVGGTQAGGFLCLADAAAYGTGNLIGAFKFSNAGSISTGDRLVIRPGDVMPHWHSI